MSKETFKYFFPSEEKDNHMLCGERTATCISVQLLKCINNYNNMDKY